MGIWFLGKLFRRDEHCKRCSKAVVISYRGSFAATGSWSTETIACPWCGHKWTQEIPGQLLQVEKATDRDARLNRR
jgi:DNA-directed RNA polymerase subunit RPC12/RpoP